MNGIDYVCMRCGKEVDFYDYYKLEIAPIYMKINGKQCEKTSEALKNSNIST